MDIIILSAILFFIFSFYKPRSKVQIKFLFLVLFIISAFRAPSEGIDLPRYVASFEKHDLRILSQNLEVGFTYLMNFFSYINNSSLFFTFVTSLLVLIPLYLFLKRESKNVYLSLLLYVFFAYYTESFNIVRQSIAISVILLGFSLFINKRYLLGLLLVFVACSIHYSAIFIFPIYFLTSKYVYIKPNVAMLLITTTIIIALTQALRLEAINSSLINKYILIESYRNKASKFLFQLNIYDRGVLGYIFIYLPSSIFTIVCSYMKKNKSKYTQLLIIGTIIQNLVYYFAVVDRFALYLLIFQIVVFVNVYEENKNRLKVPFTLLLMYYCILFIFRYSMQNLSGVYPYDFV